MNTLQEDKEDLIFILLEYIREEGEFTGRIKFRNFIRHYYNLDLREAHYTTENFLSYVNKYLTEKKD